MPTRPSSSIGRASARRRLTAAMQRQHLGDLVADGEDRVQRGHRLLEDHRHPVAAQPLQRRARPAPAGRCPSNRIAPEAHAHRRLGQQPHHRQRGDRLAAARTRPPAPASRPRLTPAPRPRPRRAAPASTRRSSMFSRAAASMGLRRSRGARKGSAPSLPRPKLSRLAFRLSIARGDWSVSAASGAAQMPPPPAPRHVRREVPDDRDQVHRRLRQRRS